MTQLSEPQVHRWTRHEYYRMADAGLFHDRRVELIEGKVVDMPPQKNAHYTAILLVQRALEKAFGTNHTVRVQGPLDLGERSQPEPDVAVVTGSPRDYRDHPKTAVLVVEVSDTTLEFDRVRKQRVYAKAGIQEFWIVNLIARTLEAYRSPVPDAQDAHYDDIEPVAEGPPSLHWQCRPPPFASPTYCREAAQDSSSSRSSRPNVRITEFSSEIIASASARFDC